MEAQLANNQNKKVLTKDFEAKFRNKGEVYRFLDNDVDVYLPPRDCVTIYFLKDLMTGRRKCKFVIAVNDSLQGSTKRI